LAVPPVARLRWKAVIAWIYGGGSCAARGKNEWSAAPRGSAALLAAGRQLRHRSGPVRAVAAGPLQRYADLLAQHRRSTRP